LRVAAAKQTDEAIPVCHCERSEAIFFKSGKYKIPLGLQDCFAALAMTTSQPSSITPQPCITKIPVPGRRGVPRNAKACGGFYML
jgi:hypothetical protein